MRIIYNLILALIISSPALAQTSRVPTDSSSIKGAWTYIIIVAVIMGIVAIIKKLFGKSDKN